MTQVTPDHHLQIIFRFQSCDDEIEIIFHEAVLAKYGIIERIDHFGAIREVGRFDLISINKILLNADIIGNEIIRVLYRSFFTYSRDIFHESVPLASSPFHSVHIGDNAMAVVLSFQKTNRKSTTLVTRFIDDVELASNGVFQA